MIPFKGSLPFHIPSDATKLMAGKRHLREGQGFFLSGITEKCEGGQDAVDFCKRIELIERIHSESIKAAIR